MNIRIHLEPEPDALDRTPAVIVADESELGISLELDIRNAHGSNQIAYLTQSQALALAYTLHQIATRTNLA